MKETSLFWEIRCDGIPGPSYLFGTIHVSPVSVQPRLEKVFGRLREVSLFASEMDLEDLSTIALATAFLLPDDQRLSGLMGKKKFVKLQGIFQKAFSLDLRYFDRFIPLYFLNQMGATLDQAGASFSPDQLLWDRAKEYGQATTGLIPSWREMEVLKRIPLDDQMRALLQAGKQVSSFRKRSQSLFRWYEAGSLRKLYQVSRKQLGSSRSLLLYERNERMAAAMLDHLARVPSFFAVGAAHLPGEKGILRTLKKQNGIRLEPLPI